METVMTIGGVNCNAQVLLNELTCRIPKGVVIPSAGLPVRVRGLSFKSPIIQMNCNHHEQTICAATVGVSEWRSL